MKIYLRKVKNSVLLLLLSMAFYMMLSGFAYKADVKIGYMNPEKIFSTYSEFVDNKKTHDAERLQYENEYKTKEQALQTAYQEAQSQSLLLSEERKEEKRKELENMQAELQNYYQNTFNPQTGVLAKRWNILMQPIIDRVQNIIDKIGPEQNYTMIFDASKGTIIYADKTADLTDMILEELNKGK